LHKAQDAIIVRAPPIRLADLYVTFAWSILANFDSTSASLLTLPRRIFAELSRNDRLHIQVDFFGLTE
jgi:hypothetical protein